MTGVVGYPSSNHPLVHLKKQILERLQRENTTKQSMDTDREFVVVVEKIPVFNSNFHKTAFTKNCHFFLTHTSCLKIKIKNVHST